MSRNLFLILMVLCGTLTQKTYAQQVDVWATKGDESIKLQQLGGTSFGSNGNAPNTITIQEATTYQSIAGFGFALTQGSAEVIQGLNSNTKNSLLQELFDPNTGNAISIIRISIGASDLSNSSYSYNETPGDVNMNNFSLAGPDLTYLIPVIKDILAINPNIKVLATPWTAPTWMKTNNAWIGGSLQTQYYGAYANYFVKYLQAMQAEGIPIWAITPQNEPENPWNEPSMTMNSTEQKNFINNHLGPAIQNAGFNTKIIAFDHNCDNTAYPIDVLNNSSYVEGAAFHLYAGDISAMSTVKNQTGKNVYFTEQYTDVNGNFGGDLGWHMENVVIGSLRNWSRSVIEWNLATDNNHGPRTPGGCTECLGALTIHNSNSFTRNVSYYIIGQVSKFVQPGAVRMESNNTSQLVNVAFKNPDGSNVLLVYNKSAANKSTQVEFNGTSFVYDIPGNTAITFTWAGSSNPTPPNTPTNLTATAQSSSTINLSWSDNSNNESNFIIERSNNGNNGWTTISTPGANTTSYSDNGLAASSTYYYRVSASNAAGNSGYSNTSSATTSAQPTTDPFQVIQAENYSFQSGTQLENTSDTGGGQNVGYIDSNDYIAFTNVDFQGGATSVDVRVAKNTSFTGEIQFRLGSTTGTLIGTLYVESTGGWQTWQTMTTSISGVSGVQDLYLVFQGGNGICNVNWLQFANQTSYNDQIISIQAPDEVSPGSIVTVTVNYEASTTRDINVLFQLNRGPWTSYGENTQTVNAGSGTINVNINVSSGTPISPNEAKFQVWMTPQGQNSWNDRLSNIEKGPVAVVAGPLSAFGKIEAESFNNQSGIQVENCSDTGGGQNVGWTDTNDYIMFENIDFGSGASGVDLRVAKATSFTANIELRLGSTNGTLIGTSSFGSTGGWQNWQTQYTNISGANGIHDLYIVFKGGSGICNLNWFQFYSGSGSRMASADTDIEQTKNFSIYPNPVINNELQIEVHADGFNNAEISLINLLGKVVYTSGINQGMNSIQLPASIVPGTYLIKISGSGHQYIDRLLIRP